MALFQSNHAKGLIPTPAPHAAGILGAATFEFKLKGALAAGDIIEMGELPANARLVDAILDSDDLDSGATPTITLDAGIMSGTAGKNDPARTCGNELFAGSAVAQAGGVARVSKAVRTAGNAENLGVGVRVATGPATGATTGTIRLTVFFTF